LQDLLCQFWNAQKTGELKSYFWIWVWVLGLGLEVEKKIQILLCSITAEIVEQLFATTTVSVKFL
jgi:hypothetical protein